MKITTVTNYKLELEGSELNALNKADEILYNLKNHDFYEYVDENNGEWISNLDLDTAIKSIKFILTHPNASW